MGEERWKKVIEAMPGEDGWWKQDGLHEFERLYHEMCVYEVPREVVLDWLERAYSAVREEYGD